MPHDGAGMDERLWHPRCERPDGLVRPVRLDPSGVNGPTRSQARGRRWRSSGHGWYVDATAAPDCVEQRILEQAVKVERRGVVTGWAVLRWHGARYFDGRTDAGRVERQVPLIRLSGRYPSGADWRRHIIGRNEQEVVAGIRCASVQRALFDEMRFAGLREAVVAMEMTAAAGLVSSWLMALYTIQRAGWQGMPLVREALLLASDESRSPQETRLKLIWVIDAGLPYPQVNRPVFDLRGNLLGVPDLLDAELGVVGEYDGVDHKSRARHQRDVAREQRYREHGLEYFTVVGGDMRDVDMIRRRMHAARSRARQLRLPRRWTLTPPPWWRPEESLDARLIREGRVGELIRS